MPSRADGLENVEFAREDESWWNRSSENSWIWAVTINGENVYTLNYGESVRFGLEPGQYSFGVRCKRGDLVQTVLDNESTYAIQEITAEITNSFDMVRFSIGHPICSIRRVPLRSAEGIENIEIIPGKQAKGLRHTTFITVNGEDFISFRRVRFGLETGNHTVGVRCWNNEGELHQEEVAVTIKDNAPLLKLFAGRGTDTDLCYIYEAATRQNSMDNQP